MSIVQSVLLLLCLALVIFSRVSGGANIDFPTLHSRARLLSGFPIESPLESPGEGPEYRRTNGRVWLEVSHQRQLSDDEAELPTPVSAYSRSEEVNFTPPSGGDDLTAGSNGDILISTEDPLQSPSENQNQNHTPVKRVPPNSTFSSPQNKHLEPTTPKSRTSKKRKGFIKQRSTSVENEAFGNGALDGNEHVHGNVNGNGMSPPLISIQDATPLRTQRELSPSPSPTPEKKRTKVRMMELDGVYDGTGVRERNEQHLPSPPPDPIPADATGTETAPGTETGTETHTVAAPAPVCPRALNSETESPNRQRESGRKQSFSIARKPLPALPPDA